MFLQKQMISYSYMFEMMSSYHLSPCQKYYRIIDYTLHCTFHTCKPIFFNYLFLLEATHTQCCHTLT